MTSQHKHHLVILTKPRGPITLYFRCTGCGKLRGYRRIGIYAMLLMGMKYRPEFNVLGETRRGEKSTVIRGDDGGEPIADVLASVLQRFRDRNRGRPLVAGPPPVPHTVWIPIDMESAAEYPHRPARIGW